jgi:prepilin-type processing-associated H-X9-DG protein
MRRLANVIVVVLILVICAGFTVAAIVRVREAAARISCTNNLKQIGQSVYAYGDENGKLPPVMPNPDLRPEQRLSWIVAIVNYTEATNLYSRMDTAKGWEAEENHFAALMRWRTFECPSFPQGTPVGTLVPTNYIGVAGLRADAATLPKGDPRAGLFGYDREVKPKDIQGRASNLLAVAETGRAEGTWIAAGPPTVRGLEADGSPYLGRGGQFGGLHWHGTNVLMADGSVRSLNDDTAADVLESMAVLSDGK